MRTFLHRIMVAGGLVVVTFCASQSEAAATSQYGNIAKIACNQAGNCFVTGSATASGTASGCVLLPGYAFKITTAAGRTILRQVLDWRFRQYWNGSGTATSLNGAGTCSVANVYEDLNFVAWL